MNKNEINIAIGDKLKQLRKTLGFSQDDLSAAIGLTRTSVVNIEKGRQSLTIENLYKICEAFKIEPSEFLVKTGGSINLIIEAKIWELKTERDGWRSKYLSLTKLLNEVNDHINFVDTSVAKG